MAHSSSQVDSSHLLAPLQLRFQLHNQMVLEMNHFQEVHHAQESSKTSEIDGCISFQNLQMMRDKVIRP